jgi:hypothetical protein
MSQTRIDKDALQEAIKQINLGNQADEQLELLFILLSEAEDEDVTLVHNCLASLAMDLKEGVHPKAFSHLTELLVSNPRYNLSILDAISNLHIPSDDINALLDTVLGFLKSADLDQLPVYIKFLLYTADSTNCTRILTGCVLFSHC